MSIFECRACGRKQEHDASRGHVPPGWAIRRIGGRALTLCESCGHEGHFVGGLSPTLRDLLRTRGIVIEDE